MKEEDIELKLEGVKSVHILKSKKGQLRACDDQIVLEEPLEIRLSKGLATSLQLAVMMRTPGDDKNLVSGFLFTEGIIQSIEEIEAIHISNHIAEVRLALNCGFELSGIKRRLLVSSSCGVCGKRDLQSLQYTSDKLPWSSKVTVTINALSQMSQFMKDKQELFSLTGGSHAAALFSKEGGLQHISEDIGRHNALDKLIGASIRNNIESHIICVSGRSSYELVQKTAMYGAPILLSIGPASSLAIETAEAEGITLVGFLSDEGCNIYSAHQRIVKTSSPSSA